MKNNFLHKVSIVKSGKSRIFDDWRKYSSITEDDFIAALEWLCDDPMPGGRLSREIGLSPSGMVKLARRYGDDGLCVFYKNGKLWGGERFYREPENAKEKLFVDDSGMIPEYHKISISCKDRV